MGVLLIALVFGLLAGIFAIEVSPLDGRYAIAAAALVSLLAISMALPRRARTAGILALLIFGISIKLNKTLFIVEFSQWQYVPFAGGAHGITVGLNDIAALVLLIGAWQRRNNSLERPALVWPILSGPLLFMTAGLASVWHAGDPSLVGFELWRQSMLVLSLLAAMNLTRAQAHTALRLLALSIVVQAGIACTQYITHATLGLGAFGEQDLVEEQIDFTYQARAVGTIGHSNVLSYFFEISLPLMLALLMAARGLRDRLIFGAGVLAGLAGVFVTLSRAAWIAVPITMAAAFLFLHGRKLFRLRSALAGMILAMLAGGALAAAWPTLSTRIFADDAGSTDARAPLNRAALAVIEQFPVFGVGLNNLANAFTQLDTTQNTRVFIGTNHVVHNMYLYVTAETGLVGLAAFLWSFGGALWIGFSLWRSPDPWARAIGVGGSFGLMAHMIHGCFDPGFKLSLPISSLIAVQAGMIGWAWLAHRRALAGSALVPAKRVGITGFMQPARAARSG